MSTEMSDVHKSEVMIQLDELLASARDRGIRRPVVFLPDEGAELGRVAMRYHSEIPSRLHRGPVSTHAGRMIVWPRQFAAVYFAHYGGPGDGAVSDLLEDTSFGADFWILRDGKEWLTVSANRRQVYVLETTVFHNRLGPPPLAPADDGADEPGLLRVALGDGVVVPVRGATPDEALLAAILVWVSGTETLPPAKPGDKVQGLPVGEVYLVRLLRGSDYWFSPQTVAEAIRAMRGAGVIRPVSRINSVLNRPEMEVLRGRVRDHLRGMRSCS